VKEAWARAAGLFRPALQEIPHQAGRSKLRSEQSRRRINRRSV